MINSAHIHLILVHLPIVIFPLGTLLLATHQVKSNETIRNLGCILLVLATAFAIPAYLTGEGAEELVEEIKGVLESDIENHEDAAVISLWLSCITALVAASSFIPRVKSMIKGLPLILITLGTISSLSLFWVGYQGGKIRHPEAYAASSGSTENGASEEGDRDDDD